MPLLLNLCLSCDEKRFFLSNLCYLPNRELNLIKSYFSPSRDVVRVDDLRVIGGIIFVLKAGFRWRYEMREYGPIMTLYNRFVRRSRMGEFSDIFCVLSRKVQGHRKLRANITYLKAHRTSASLLKKDVSRAIGQTRGVLNSKLYAVCNEEGRPVALHLWSDTSLARRPGPKMARLNAAGRPKCWYKSICFDPSQIYIPSIFLTSV